MSHEFNADHLSAVPSYLQHWRPFRGQILPPPVEDARASELYDALTRANAHVAEAHQIEKDAQQAHLAAFDALEAEQQRCAEAGVISKIDAELLATRESAALAASPDLHVPRRQAAARLAETAQTAYLNYCTQHAHTWAEKLRPESEKVAAEIASIQAATERRLKPLGDRHAALVQAYRFVYGGTEGIVSTDIQDEFGQPVGLKPDALARINGEAEPELDPGIAQLLDVSGRQSLELVPVAELGLSGGDLARVDRLDHAPRNTRAVDGLDVRRPYGVAPRAQPAMGMERGALPSPSNLQEEQYTMPSIHLNAASVAPIPEGTGTGDPSPFKTHMKPTVANGTTLSVAQGSILATVAAETEQSD